jgi:DNA invertase Pin-like site-specific DNA recombinase
MVAGRLTRDALNTLAAITGNKAGLRSLGDAWGSTTSTALMLTVLGGLAEFERDLIRAAAAAKATGVKARGVKSPKCRKAFLEFPKGPPGTSGS